MASPAAGPPRACELTHMAATGLGMNTSPTIRTLTGLPLTVSVTLSPVPRWVSEANAVLTSIWPGPLYQHPLTRLQPSHDESPSYAYTISGTSGRPATVTLGLELGDPGAGMGMYCKSVSAT